MLPARSLVIPMFNEASRIGASLAALAQSSLNSCETEFVLVDDGSSDGTAELAAKLAAEAGLPVQVVRLGVNQGKGAAVKAGMLQATGLTRAYVDADLSVSIEDIDACFAAIEGGSAEVVFATRAHSNSDMRSTQPPHRVLSGRVFNFFLRRLGLTDDRDTQCGLKGFTGPAADALFGALVTTGFAFDVELLARANRSGFTMAPMGVTWNHADGSRVRPFRDGLDMAWAALKVRRLVGPRTKAISR